MPQVKQVRIPDEDLPKLRRLLDVRSEDLTNFADTMRHTTPEFDATAFVSKVVQKTSLPENDARMLFSVLGSLYATRSRYLLNVDEFVDVIQRSIQGSGSGKEWSGDAVNWDEFKGRLSLLLDLDKTLGVVTKARHLRVQHERVLHDLQVYTDLRPIFESDPAHQPVAGMINHMIRISFHHHEDMKEIFIAVDDEDLRDIQTSVERALKKSQSLQNLLSSASIPLLEEPESDD